ncbi:MAG: hypothetical protein VW338_00875 [Rhodospirillaceae bacterium]
MARVANWPRRLIEAVDRHRALPASWGQSDCFRFAMDCVEAVTGTDPYADVRGSYDGPVTAARRLKERGFADLEAALAAAFPEVPAAKAQRGDLGVTAAANGAPACVVFVDAGVIGRGEGELLRFPRSVVTRAFKVG